MRKGQPPVVRSASPERPSRWAEEEEEEEVPLREEEARARTKEEEEEEEEPRTVTPGSRGGGRGRRWKRIQSGVEIISWKTCNE